MSVLTPKRVFVVVLTVGLLLAGSAEAAPSPRSYARMAFDQSAGVGVLFGGRGAFDGATQLTHASNETWIWTGVRWTQRFPAVSPPARSTHSMTWDSNRNRVLLFGGRQEPEEPEKAIRFLDDTWAWQNEQWVEIETAQAPRPRNYAAMAYDPLRDRVVLFGGIAPSADGKTTQNIHDTWEFNGTDWQQVGAAAEPAVVKPAMAWDAARGEMILMGTLADLTAVMYRYRPASSTWERITPETMPTCVSEGQMVYRPRTQSLLWTGGVCAVNTPLAEEIFEWNGTNWSKITVNDIPRSTGQAVAFDTVRNTLVTYGGPMIFSADPRSSTYTLKDSTWQFNLNATKPVPRSLAIFETDPNTGSVWLYGGLDETSSFYLNDLWGYRGGQWYRVRSESEPGIDCAGTLAAYDTDRQRLVVVCGGGPNVHEWNGTSWTAIKDLKKFPSDRRFAGMVYDQNLKRTVLFGGYGANYRDDTWTWNGTEWTEVKGAKPPHRGQMAMWYDPLQKKTILYGGLGRRDIYQKVTRYSDMWSFDGTNWTKMSVPETPGERFGPQIAVNPESGRLLLFGGLRAETVDGKTIRQFFADDTWEWDGAASRWTRLAPARSAIARENGALAWDPVQQRMVMFGGYKEGFFLSDVWTWTGTAWQPTVENPARRRAAGPGSSD